MSTRSGVLRRRAILALLPRDAPGPIVDVGADHGHVAAASGAVATERLPHRRGREDVPWVVADGLRPFRRVGVAIVTGMGAHTILGILDDAPRPRWAVLHAPDDPTTLRRGLVARGWRIDAEALAPETRRHAEILRVTTGEEDATGLRLDIGPRWLEGDDPHAVAHAGHEWRHWSRLAAQVAGHDPERARYAAARAARLADALTRWGAPPPG